MYYAGIQRLLRKFLPKGKQNERLRRIIYDEKNVYLSRGMKKDDRGIRGADGRMGYLADHQQALTEVIEWARTKQSMADLYKVFGSTLTLVEVAEIRGQTRTDGSTL